MAFLQAARPGPAIDLGEPEPGALRRARADDRVVRMPDGSMRRVDELSTVPGTSSYASKVPPPPCFKCGEDHVPNGRYDHPWMAEPRVISGDPQVHQMIHDMAAPSPYSQAATVSVQEVPQRRVAIYVGKGETYVVAVESAPDWDTQEAFKVPEDRVLGLVRLARALGVKVADKTGGDLVMLEQADA